MKYYSYVISRDYGFAPNPYFGYCTLATCKPIIRRVAKVGDWIAAFGKSQTTIKGKLVVLMQVNETLSLDEYWEDIRFIKKRPVFNRSIRDAYGDNIYHHSGSEWSQEFSHHSMSNGSVNYTNLEHDTGTNRVLVSKRFYYFGNNAIDIPNKFFCLVGEGRNHRVTDDESLITSFVDYIGSIYNVGVHGVPFDRISGAFAHYKGESS